MDWQREARMVLKAELARKNVGYKGLVTKLEGMGLAETERSIANKLSRGTFSFVFFMQCMKALGEDSVTIKLPK